MPLRFTIQELSKYVEEIFPQVKDDFEILEISIFHKVKVNFYFGIACIYTTHLKPKALGFR